MAVDKKSDHVGNHGGAYLDNDGQRKQFVTIDHDKKLKITGYTESERQAKEREEWMENYIKEKIEIVLMLPAMNIYDFSGGIYNDLLHITSSKVTWNEEAVTSHIRGNPSTFLHTALWRKTVTMANWHHPKWQEGDMDWLRSREWETLM